MCLIIELIVKTSYQNIGIIIMLRYRLLLLYIFITLKTTQQDRAKRGISGKREAEDTSERKVTTATTARKVTHPRPGPSKVTIPPEKEKKMSEEDRKVRNFSY